MAPVLHETSQLKDDYLAAKRSGWSDANYQTRLGHLRKFAAYCRALPLEPEPIERFISGIPNARYRYNVWCSIRLFYEWLAFRRGLPNPCLLIEAPKKPLPTPYYLELDQLRQLLEYPHSPRNSALLWLLLDTGMRRGEAHSMTVENMRDNEDNSGWLYVDGKSGPRWVPVSANVWSMLKAIAPESGPFWRGKRGPMSVHGIGTTVWTCFARAGLVGDKMSSHRLRHTFCTLWDGSDSDGMDIVGHSDWKTWRLYKHTRTEQLKRAHGRHSPAARLLTTSGVG